MKRYKGYDAQIVYDPEASVFHGSVPNIRGVITFEGTSVAELESAFHESVDYYLDFCERNGVDPARPYSGNFVLRSTPDLHARVAARAAADGLSLNAWVVRTLEDAVRDEASGPGGATEAPAPKPNGRRRSVPANHAAAPAG